MGEEKEGVWRGSIAVRERRVSEGGREGVRDERTVLKLQLPEPKIEAMGERACEERKRRKKASERAVSNSCWGWRVGVLACR